MQSTRLDRGRFWSGFIGQSRSKSYGDPKNLPTEHCVQHATVHFRTDAAATPVWATRSNAPASTKVASNLKKVRQYSRELPVSVWAYLPAEASCYEKIVYTISETK
jgi:hypothetical protein